MALLLLRHALAITNGDDEDDASTIFSVSVGWFVFSLKFMPICCCSLFAMV